MANTRHLLLTAVGDYTESALIGEQWAVTLRLALVFGSVDDVGTLPDDWNPSANNVNRTETDWTIQGNWHVSAGGHTFQPDDYLNDQAAPAFIAWAGALPAWSSHNRLRELNLYPINQTGHVEPAPPYSQGTPMKLTWTSSYPAGTSGGNRLPLQIAPVASHRTPQTGRRGRGRMFIPGFTTSLTQADSTIATLQCEGIRDAQIALLEGLKYDSLTPGDPKVRPIITGAPWQNYGVINQVRVGNIGDTQRRRRAQLDETYVSGTVTY